MIILNAVIAVVGLAVMVGIFYYLIRKSSVVVKFFFFMWFSIFLLNGFAVYMRIYERRMDKQFEFGRTLGRVEEKLNITFRGTVERDTDIEGYSMVENDSLIVYFTKVDSVIDVLTVRKPSFAKDIR